MAREKRQRWLVEAWIEWKIGANLIDRNDKVICLNVHQQEVCSEYGYPSVQLEAKPGWGLEILKNHKNKKSNQETR